MTGKKSILALEDGSVYEGYSFGAEEPAYGEVVFSTSMTGYQEILTDPSYAGQILVPTYPLIGNYGINDEDFESERAQVTGFVVREQCEKPSHGKSRSTLDEFLKSQRIPGIAGVDTRSLVRRLRSFGVMMGTIPSEESQEEALARLASMPRYDFTDFVKGVTAREFSLWGPDLQTPVTSSSIEGIATELEALGSPEQPHIVVVDLGLKYNIRRSLNNLNCLVSVVPCTTPATDILEKLNPDGVVLSPGPGDPVQVDYLQETVKTLIEEKPIMGICLGHQLIARAFGAETFKLRFGHRGANHPVRDLKTGRLHITAQNHGYAVDSQTVTNGLEVSHINLNDNTVEGLRHKELPIFSIQYHSEASPGPRDNMYLFERFLEMVKGNRNG
ncbi:MAG: glutamine-hydrolyzing carbamoyl-phosphate synthase small subunit [Chloroflexota bacterium]